MTFPNTRAALGSLAFTHDVSAAVADLAEADEEIANMRAALAQKDATLKALAEQLMRASLRRMPDGSPCWCFGTAPHYEECEPKRAALRLAGVLK